MSQYDRAADMHAVTQRKFYDEYWDYFTLVEADTQTLRERCFAVRYPVYCQDSAQFNREAMEIDAYDIDALHFLLIHKASGETAGTVRVILPKAHDLQRSFPLQEFCAGAMPREPQQLAGVCEISRLCMAERFRRRAGDGRILPAYAEQQVNGDLMPLARAIVGRRVTYAPLGLMMAAFRAALDRGIEDAVSAFDPADFKSLKRIGFDHCLLGPRIDMHGAHQPVTFHIPAVLDRMEAVNPECWDIVSDKGALHSKAVPDIRRAAASSDAGRLFF